MKRVAWYSLGCVAAATFLAVRSYSITTALDRPTRGLTLRDATRSVSAEQAIARHVELAMMSGASPAMIGFSARVGGARAEGVRAVVARVESGSPAERAGAAPGDTIASVDGVPVGDAATAERRLSGAAGSLRVVHLRGATERDLVIESVPTAESGRPITSWFVEFYFQFVTFTAFVTGFVVFVARPLETRSVVFLLMMCGIALSVNARMEGAAGWLASSVRFATTPIVVSFGSFFLHFALLFPSRADAVERRPWLLRVIYLPLSLSTGWMIVNALGVSDPSSLIPAPWGAIMALAFVVEITAGVLRLVHVSRSTDDPNERKRLRILLFGVFVGLLPALAMFIAFISLPGLQDRVPVGLVVLVAAFLLLFPGSFLYAILRHRVFGLRLALRRGVQYTLFSFGATAMLSWFEVIAAVLLVFDVVGQGFRPHSVIGLSALAAWLLIDREYGVKRRVLSAIDRRFYRDSYEGLGRVQELAREVPGFVDAESLLERVAAVLSASFHVPRVYVFVSAGGGYVVGTCRCPEGAPARVDLSDQGAGSARGQTVAFRRMDEAIVISTDERGWQRPGRIAEDWEEGLLLGLSSRGERRGLVLLGPKLSEEPYAREERDAVAALAGQLAVALANTQLYEEVVAKRLFEEELRTAREIQARFLPSSPPRVPGYEIAAVNVPSGEVGGDYYDFIPGPDGRMYVAVADVSGKGVPAALLLSQLQAAMTAQVRHGKEPGEVISTVNEMLIDKVAPGSFATCFFARLDPQSLSLSYVNAGHDPPIIIRPRGGELELLQDGGLLLGVFPNVRFNVGAVSLSPGDVVVAYTDGVTEASRSSGDKSEEYGSERLVARVFENLDRPLDDVVRAVMADVDDFGNRADDFTLLLIRRL